MLGEGLRAGLAHVGLEARTVFYVEREAHAAAVLAARCEDGSLDDAPIWSDLLTFNGRRFRGVVDCIAAGFPCQDLSLAGRRAGLDGKRSGLFFDILDIADACGAWCLFLENVSAIATATAAAVDEAEGDVFERAASRVVGELAERGWHAEWLTLSASDVGGSHGRERWFCFAWRVMEDAQHVAGLGIHARQGEPGHGAANARRADHDMGNADGQREREPDHTASAIARGSNRRAGPRPRAGGAGVRMAESSSIGRDEGRPEHAGQQGRSDAAIDGGTLADAAGRRAPAAEQPGRGNVDIEDGDALADAGREPRRHRDAGTDRSQADAVGRGLATASDGGDVLADAGHGARADEPQRIAGRSNAPELRLSGIAVAYSNLRRLGVGGRGGLDRGGESATDAVVDDGMADAGQPRLPDAQLEDGGGARARDEGRTTAELCSAPFLFAPGPSDPRWPDILDSAAYLAPALEPAFRCLVDGMAFDMGDSRAARLKCVGNGVVPAQAGVAFVELLRRAREGVA